MQRLSIESAQKLLVALVLVLMSASFLRIAGTGDVQTYKSWIVNAVGLGAVRGYAENAMPDPPLSSLVFYAGFRLLHPFGPKKLVVIKLVILLFSVATSVVFWLWTREFWMTVIFHLSLLVNSVLLGYEDPLMGLPVLLGLWALQKRKLWAVTLCFATAILIKWTPLILLPFAALYVFNVQGATGWRRINFGGILVQMVLPALAIVALVVLVYGYRATSAALVGGFSHTWLSGDAMNLGWILTHWLHVHQPAQYGPLIGQQAESIFVPAPEVSRWPRILFWFFYLSTLAAFLWRAKTFENFIHYALIGFVMYFTFNRGVHENHLYLAVLLAFLLAWLNRRYLFTAAFWILMFNMNMILFYGFEGELTFKRAIFGVDMPLVFSVLIVIYALGMWLSGLRPQRGTDGKGHTEECAASC